MNLLLEAKIIMPQKVFALSSLFIMQNIILVLYLFVEQTSLTLAFLDFLVPCENCTSVKLSRFI